MTTYANAVLINYSFMKDEDTQLNEESADELWTRAPIAYRNDPCNWRTDETALELPETSDDWFFIRQQLIEEEAKECAKLVWEERKMRRSKPGYVKKVKAAHKKRSTDEEAENERVMLHRKQIEELLAKKSKLRQNPRKKMEKTEERRVPKKLRSIEMSEKAEKRAAKIERSNLYKSKAQKDGKRSQRKREMTKEGSKRKKIGMNVRKSTDRRRSRTKTRDVSTCEGSSKKKHRKPKKREKSSEDDDFMESDASCSTKSQSQKKSRRRKRN